MYFINIRRNIKTASPQKTAKNAKDAKGYHLSILQRMLYVGILGSLKPDI